MITCVAVINRKAAWIFRAVDDDQARAMIDDQEGSTIDDPQTKKAPRQASNRLEKSRCNRSR